MNLFFILQEIVIGISITIVTPGQDVWKNQNTGVDASLRGLCVVNQNVVWSSGTNGTVIKTTNAGESWVNVSIPRARKLDFRDIQAFDENRAVVLSAGQPARVYLTVDGGESWKMTFEHSDQRSFFDALSFWDQKNGIAMSDPIDGRVVIVLTRDGGKTWAESPPASRPKTERGEGGFAASGTNMIVVGQRCLIALGSGEELQEEPTSRIVYSDDRGQSWRAANVPLKRNSSSGIFSMAFADEKIGVAVGGDYLKPEIKSDNLALSSDGGVSWIKSAGIPPRGYRSGVAFMNDRSNRIVVAVGPDGTDLSNDDGENWAAASDSGFHAVACTPDGSNVWASGSEGRIAKWIRRR